MAVPKYYEFFNPTLEALHGLGGSATIEEMADSISANMGLSEKDLNEILRGTMTKFYHRLGWARNYLKNFGLLENTSRGVWALTPRGREIRAVDPKDVIAHVRALRQSSVDDSDDEGMEVPDEGDPEWIEQLLNLLKAMDPAAFERLCQRLLRESGFTQVEVTGRSGDGGIDGRGVVKIGGLLSFHVHFQCKRYKTSVGPDVIRDFRGAMVGRADKGILITTATFTREARREAQRDGAPPLDLIDGVELADKLKDLRLGISVKERIEEDVTIDAQWYEDI